MKMPSAHLVRMSISIKFNRSSLVASSAPSAALYMRSPGSRCNLTITELRSPFFAYTVLILGGAARVLAPIAGAVIFWFLLVFVEQMLRQAVSAGYIPEWLIGVNQVGQIRFMLVGLGLMMLMIFRPQGIFGDRKELALDARA